MITPAGITVAPDGGATFDGVDYGRNIVQERHLSADHAFSTAKDAIVFYVPGQDYFAARNRRGYAPAHYLVFTYVHKTEDPGIPGRFRYTGLTPIAELPLRRGAVQKS